MQLLDAYVTLLNSLLNETERTRELHALALALGQNQLLSDEKLEQSGEICF